MLYLIFFLFYQSVKGGFNPCENVFNFNIIFLSCDSIESFMKQQFFYSEIEYDFIEINCKNSHLILDLDIQYLNNEIQIPYTIRLTNFNSIIIKKNLSTLSTSPSIYIEKIEIHNSTLDTFYYNETDNSTKNTCEILESIIIHSYLIKFIQEIVFMESTKFPKILCPALWHFVYNQKITFIGLNDKTKFSLPKIAPEFTFSLHSEFTSKTLNIVNSSLSLDLNFLNYDYYPGLKEIIFENSSLFNIEDKNFEKMYLLQKIELNLNNFKEFIQKSDNKWMNIEYYYMVLDINDCHNILTNLRPEGRLILVLNDLTKTYEFPDSDFCHFKYLYHNELNLKKFLFPIVYTKEKLNCTCTLLGLVLNWRLNDVYNKISNESVKIRTESVSNCFINFDLNVKACKFKNKLKKCGLNWDQSKFIFECNFNSLKNSIFQKKPTIYQHFFILIFSLYIF